MVVKLTELFKVNVIIFGNVYMNMYNWKNLKLLKGLRNGLNCWK